MENMVWKGSFGNRNCIKKVGKAIRKFLNWGGFIREVFITYNMNEYAKSRKNFSITIEITERVSKLN